MFELLGNIFFALMGVVSAFSALLFAGFTIISFSLIVHAWLDKTFTLRDRAWITLLLSAVVVWGAWLTYLAGYYAVHWTHLG